MPERNNTGANKPGKGRQALAEDPLVSALQRFKAILFPLRKETKVDEKVIDRLMLNTKTIRQSFAPGKPRVLLFPYPSLLATAACLMLVLGAAFLFHPWQGNHSINTVPPDSNAFVMRGGEPPVTSTEAITAIGYLMDVKGQVGVLRGGTKLSISLSCIHLQIDDIISLGGEGHATVLLPDRAYVINKAGKYRIAEVDVVEVKENSETTVDPVLGTRGNPLLGRVSEQVVLPPKVLFAAVKPPVMRTVSKIEVLSPSGLTLNTTPDLVWTGSETNEYAVQIMPIEAAMTNAAFPPINITGCKLKWSQTGWPSIKRDKSYRVVLSQQGEVLTDASHTFHVADAAAAQKMEPKIAAIEKDLPAGIGREMVEANLMANPEYGYYAEARLIVVGLLKKDPQNPIYLRLMQRCYAGMGSAQGYESVERRLSRETPVGGRK